MPDLWPVLGYDGIAADIAEAMRDSARINLVEGPPGIGKSRLAEGIGALWEESGGGTLIARGDNRHSHSALHPLRSMIAGKASGLRAVGSSIAATTKAGETLVGTGGVITATVQMVEALQRKRRAARRMLLGSAEQEILFDLQSLGRKRPLLLVADNLHWWDPASLDFLRRLREPQMSEAFPFLAEMRVLAVQTPKDHQETAHPDALRAFFRSETVRRFELGRVLRDDFEDVLEALGAKPRPPSEVADAVYALSGGHLALADRCVSRIVAGETSALLSAATSDEFLHKLLVDRIDSLGPSGEKALAMLQIAAVLGLSFRRDELVCVTGDPSETARLLRYCRQEVLVELDGEVGRFVHDLYQRYFLGAGSLDPTGIHESLDGCLRSLRPGEYELRCRNAVKAERSRDAAAWAVQAALQRQREGQDWRELPDDVMRVMDEEGLIPVADGFERALEHLNQYRFTECLETLSDLPRDLSKCLKAEADCLRATCLMATRSREDRSHARAILQSWSGYEEKEAEIGLRLMQLLQYALAMLPDKAAALAHEGEIMRVLRDREDTSARDAESTLDRCAGSVHGPERALIHVRRAVKHFAPEDPRALARRPVEYYRCLVNHVALLLLNADYDGARTVQADLEQLIASYAPGVFPRLDYALMNGLLADYRLGLVDAEAAARRQRELVDAHGVAGDPFYAENALAGYLALAGSNGQALDILDRLDVELTNRPNPEPSMIYVIRANRAAVRYVAGDTARARAEWADLHDVVVQIPYVTVPYLIARHELLQEVIDVGRATSALEFDECLLHEARYGPFWNQIGRGFWMPEIEWWR